ncbi:4-carboxy muconolactone decarboxylase [Polynucleobacter sp. QLW-P1DATA-2]|uniref:carboxymuconolactone decarboxylase family protein n=1 Tax=unclassified Polynucleobacter TaxID=2640945 RepID=UPI0008F81130|nr:MULTISPECIES: 4-carboxy muconolactone decarboxylase [unclassified Polynucleobacter]OIM97739.1 4-carboxy muconolactone decarboxylase [Polynucleobacter sp. MWH-Tro8-2-5-gr]OIN03381.1 4-carboxy muconolactone decarboxylase [Polynucleobacter sp. QLW-P1DATA-2]
MNLKFIWPILFSVLALSSGVFAQTRLPEIPVDQYTAEQKKAAQEFEAARKKAPWGPFAMLIYSPELMNNARAMGDYLRYNSAFDSALSEFAILITAREWSQDYEWSVHYPIAIKAGLKPEIAQALKEGRRPEGMSEDQTIVYDFTIELQRYKQVSDVTFAKTEKRFGKKGAIDLAGIAGYYTFLAMEMNMARRPAPIGGERLPRFPE